MFQIDLFSARGAMPRNIFDVYERQKDILYSSRTRKNTKHAVVALSIEQMIERGVGEHTAVPEGLAADHHRWKARRQGCARHDVLRAKTKIALAGIEIDRVTPQQMRGTNGGD